MIISAIAAVSRNGVIGRNNEIPWYLPADLQWFKKNTLHHHVIMGRNSFVSIGRPLPKRTNVVITRDPFFVATGCLVARSLEEAMALAVENGEEEAFIIGGGQIYEQSQSYWDKIYLTEVDLEVPDGDVFFPKMEEKEWQEVFREAHEPDEKNAFGYAYRILERAMKADG